MFFLLTLQSLIGQHILDGINYIFKCANSAHRLPHTYFLLVS